MGSKNLLICRACGYKILSCRLKTECPACGVSRKYFEPYKDNISIKRRRLINLHIHPIAVHFSVTTSILLLLIIASGSFLSGKISSISFSAAAVLSVLLPLFVAAGAVSGLIDGIIRFKRAKRPVLIKKIYLSIGFFISSTALIVLIIIYRFDNAWINMIMIMASLAAASLSIFLGKLGGGLSEAMLPGK